MRKITYGPCQTPTLGFCVDQAEKIKKFVAEPYWTIETVVLEKGKEFKLKWDRGKIYNRTAVTILQARIASVQQAKVIDIQKTKVTKGKP